MAITLETVAEFVADNDRQGIDLRIQMLWGYFFKDGDRRKLELLRDELEGMGYRYVDILEPLPDSPDIEFYLHVERIEHHTVQTLYQRVVDLERFAREHNVSTFDGFDVGNIDGRPLGKE